MKKADNQDGFLLLEALFSFAMFLLLCTLLLPLWIDVKKEHYIQEKRTFYYSLLQNELAKAEPKDQYFRDDKLFIALRFSIEDGLKKGCIDLRGEGRKENRCLYGYLE
ncbi:hypothetical protein SFC02_03170 [Terribacillus goriensis]|uniref:hypothetical protein n=1 Tax=Terribacillus saccharophilus TaxID=361277 RepID=UPI003983A0E7